MNSNGAWGACATIQRNVYKSLGRSSRSDIAAHGSWNADAIWTESFTYFTLIPRIRNGSESLLSFISTCRYPPVLRDGWWSASSNRVPTRRVGRPRRRRFQLDSYGETWVVQEVEATQSHPHLPPVNPATVSNMKSLFAGCKYFQQPCYVKGWWTHFVIPVFKLMTSLDCGLCNMEPD